MQVHWQNTAKGLIHAKANNTTIDLFNLTFIIICFHYIPLC